MMSKCRKCHLRETKFAKFPGGACPQTPLEAHAVGANRASLFLLKRGWNVWLREVCDNLVFNAGAFYTAVLYVQVLYSNKSMEMNYRNPIDLSIRDDVRQFFIFVD